MANQPALVRLLLEAGGDPNVPDEDEFTPLHVAARYLLAYFGRDYEKASTMYLKQASTQSLSCL